MGIIKRVRPNILQLKPYSSARDEFSGEAMVFLDANENPLNQPWNRYPDPHQRELKARIAEMKGCPPSHIFLGNGSDEPIDLLIRIFCEPGLQNILQVEPTYGMYGVAAGINNVGVTGIPLGENFRLDADRVLEAVTNTIGIIFLCSPNNPTGNGFDSGEIIKVLRGFSGPVVIDEAYADFSSRGSFLSRLGEFPNLIILQTFSKAWGMAALRLGMAFAQPEIISLMSKVKYPYNLSSLTQESALRLLQNCASKEEWVKLILQQREWLTQELSGIECVERVWPSDANFLLVRVSEARRVYEYLLRKGIVVRDRSAIPQCEGCLRITVGTAEENEKLVAAMRLFK